MVMLMSVYPQITVGLCSVMCAADGILHHACVISVSRLCYAMLGCAPVA